MLLYRSLCVLLVPTLPSPSPPSSSCGALRLSVAACTPNLHTMRAFKYLFTTVALLSLICPAFSINLYGMLPTCGPELSYSILTFNGTGFVGQNITIYIGAQSLDPSFTLSVDNTSLSFLTPKSLVSGEYDVQLCSQAPFFNCSYVCSNCSSNDSTCCQEQCTPLNPTSNCVTTALYTVYNIPPILLDISPSSVLHKSNVSLFGQHFINCGRPTVRVQSTAAVQDIPAFFNSSTEIIFYVDHSVSSGVVTLSLDGQHFDSLSVSPITLTNSPQYSSDSDSMSAGPGGSRIFSPSSSPFLISLPFHLLLPSSPLPFLFPISGFLYKL